MTAHVHSQPAGSRRYRRSIPASCKAFTRTRTQRHPPKVGPGPHLPAREAEPIGSVLAALCQLAVGLMEKEHVDTGQHNRCCAISSAGPESPFTTHLSSCYSWSVAFIHRSTGTSFAFMCPVVNGVHSLPGERKKGSWRTPRAEERLLQGVTPGVFPFCINDVHAQSRLTLGSPRDCSPLGSSVHGIFQAKILEWVAISFSRDSS